MQKNISAGIAGLLFSFGLIISDMINPQKVLNFLDITGQWDASLAFVMGGALITLGGLQRFILQRTKPIYEEKFQLPSTSQIDTRLLSGAALFGVGWGLGGLCPGPALAGMSFGNGQIYLFILGMLAGMGLFQKLHTQK